MRAPEPESFASQVILKCSIWQISTVYTMAVPAHYLAPNYMQESQKTFTLGFDMKCSSYILQNNTGVQGWITKFLKGIRLYFSLWLSMLSNEILLVKSLVIYWVQTEFLKKYPNFRLGHDLCRLLPQVPLAPQSQTGFKDFPIGTRITFH